MQTYSIRAFQAGRIVVANAFARNSKKACMVAGDLEEVKTEMNGRRIEPYLYCLADHSNNLGFYSKRKMYDLEGFEQIRKMI